MILRGRALDVGCGEGHFGRALLQSGFSEVVGVERHSAAASAARQLLTSVVEGDFLAVDPPDASPFDLVVFADSLEHMADPWRALDAAASLVAPRGHLLVSVPNVSHYSTVSQLLRGRWDYADAGLLDRTHLRFFTAATLTEAIGAAGFCVTGVTRSIVTPNAAWMRPAVAVVKACLPHLFWYQVIVVAQRV